jgi:anti-anti-sigma regulatory factor
MDSTQEGENLENNNYALVSADKKNTILAIRGVMNSDNSHAVESGLLALRAAHPHGKLSIDASVLDGVSSSGANVLKRMRKNESNMKMINVSPELYETLRENGLTKLINIEMART